MKAQPFDNKIKLVQLLLALFLGIWIPLRITFFVSTNLIDLTVEGLALFLVGISIIIGSAKGKISKPDLILDILVMLPFFSIGNTLTGTSLSYLFLIKLIYLRHLKFVRTLTERIDSLHPVIARLLPLALFFPLVLHSVACGWLVVGGGVKEFAEPTLNYYIRAVYWAVTTLATVGYGDIVPKTTPQMLYASGTMILGVGFFGYILSNVASLISRIDAAKEHQAQTIDRVEAFMRYNQIPPNLQTKVRDYFRYMWDNNKGYNDNEILSQIHPSLQLEITLAMNAGIIEKVPLLKGAEESLIRELVSKLQHLIALPNEILFHQGDEGEGMYFIHRGQIEIYSNENENIFYLKDGDFFGEIALTANKPRNANARSTSYTDLFLLKRADFERVLSHHPKFAAHIHSTIEERSLKLKDAA